MSQNSKGSALILGIFIFLGLSSLGYMLGGSALKIKDYERTVTVKGLAEREFTADIVIWPIKFMVAENDLEKLYAEVEDSTVKIENFLMQNGIATEEVSFSAPFINDKLAQQYGGQGGIKFRYSAVQTVTVYSHDIQAVRAVMGTLSALGKQGIVFVGNEYESSIEYLFTRLNEVKPEMIEDATRKAREVAEKFAADSKSTLGKIKQAQQGRFSISARDKNNPHIKKVRVVSTVVYYLSD